MDNIIGRDTKIIFEFDGTEVPSKIDTGAETSSIHCGSVFLKNGVLYCDILEKGDLIPFYGYEIRRVRSSNGKRNKRYCVNLSFLLDGKEYNCDFTLNNRGLMKYPVLLGKNFLSDNGFMVDVTQTINERIINSSIKRILKEVDEDKLYKKISKVVSPPYVTDMYKMGLSNKEILNVLEEIFGRSLKIYGIDNGGDIFVHLKEGGQWIYYEEFDGSGWEVRERNEQDNVIRKYGFDGDDHFDEIVKPINLSGLNNLDSEGNERVNEDYENIDMIGDDEELIKVDVILMGGLDYRKGDFKVNEQVTLLKSNLPDKKIVGYRYVDIDGVLSEMSKNPSAYVVLFSAGCSYASIISKQIINKNRLFIVEPYALSKNTVNSVKNAVSNGVPSKNVVTGPIVSRGSGVVNGSTKTPEGIDHWGSLKYVGKLIK